jgi:PBP1b-binding outer membrane lipoprotein LpoB
MRRASHLTTRIVSATTFSLLLFAACSKSNTADTSSGAALKATTEAAGAETQVPATAATAVGVFETTAASMQLQSLKSMLANNTLIADYPHAANK